MQIIIASGLLDNWKPEDCQWMYFLVPKVDGWMFVDFGSANTIGGRTIVLCTL